MKKKPEIPPNENGIPEEKTMMMDTSKWSQDDTSPDVRALHGIAPEVVERRPWRKRARDVLHRLLCRELRDVHAEIESRWTGGRVETAQYHEKLTKNLVDVSDAYEIGEQFASGGQSVLRFAVDRQLGRTVALKTLKENPVDPEASRQSFLHEALVTAQLEHPSVVPAYALMCDKDGGLHLAMRYMSGRTLQSYLRSLIRIYTENGVAVYDVRKNLFRRVEYFLRVCDAMEYAHAHNVLHCDLKPENIIIGNYHDVYVMDWGIARAVEDGREWVVPDKVTGTLRYMAPEIIKGARPSVQSDIFALGAILYEIVSLNNAFAGKSPTEIVRHQKTGRIGGFRHRFGLPINRDFKAVILKATDPDPARRYQSVAEFGADIRRVRRNEEISARPDTPVGKFVRWCANHPQAIAGSLLGLFLTLVAGLVFSVEHSVQAAIVQRDQDAAIAGAFGQSSLAAQNINTRFSRHIRLLNNLMEDYLMLRDAELPAAWSVNALTDRELNMPGGPAAAMLAPAAAYGWRVDFRHLGYAMPPDTAMSPEDKQNLRILSFMVPRFRHLVFKHSIGEDHLDDRPDAEVEAQIRKFGTSPHRIFFGFPDGLCAAYPGMARPPANFDPRVRSWYKKALSLHHNQIVWGRPYTDTASGGGHRLTCSMPIYDDGGVFRGVTALELDLDLLARQIARFGNQGAFVKGKYIFDRYGIICLRTDVETAAGTPRRRRLDSPVVELARRRHFGTWTENVGGKRYLWCFCYLPVPRWYYAERIDLDEFLKSVR